MSYKETIAHAEFVKLYAADVVEVIIPDVVAAEKLIWARYGISNFLPLRLFYKGAILIVTLLVFLAQLGAFPGVRQSVAVGGIGLTFRTSDSLFLGIFLITATVSCKPTEAPASARGSASAAR
jgi:hypothetical protein